jgi:hypothetical protein
MTEDESKTKWCPFFRQTDDLVTNRNDDKGWLGENGNCIGSDCMAWRRTSTETCVHGSRKIEYEVGNGFCGLAGNP